MNNFSVLDWYYKAKADPKVMAPVVIILLVLIFMGYKLFYSPKAVLLAREVKKLKALQGQISQLQTATRNADEINLEIEEAKHKFEASKQLCYKKTEITSFLRRIRELATISNIDIKSINPQPLSKLIVGAMETEKLTVAFNFKGDIIKLSIFLRLLELEEKVTFIDLPPLNADNEGNFNLTLSPSTILISEELLNSSNADHEEDLEDFEDYE